MTQFKYLGALAASAAMMLASCSDDVVINGSDGQGKLDVRLDVNSSVLASKAESRAFADNGVVTADDLAISLSSPDGSYTKEWSSIADLAANPTVGVGDYTISAHFGSIDAQGFDSPYYYGSADIKVRENETTTVALTAQLANSMFTISYTDGLKKHMAAYSAELQAAGLDPQAYPADEVRPIYVKPGNVDVYVNIEKLNGVKARLLAASVQAEPRHHYHVTVDVNNGDAGGEGRLVVTFDDSLQAEDFVVDLSDELLNTAAPELTATGFASGDELDRIIGVPYDGDLSIGIIARAGLKHVKMATEGASALGSAWPAEIDLIAADAATQASLKSLGFTAMGLWRNPGKMAVISFAPVIEHIAIAAGQAATDVKFSFTAIDRMGKASDPVTLAVHVENETIEISQGQSDFIVGQNTYTLNMKYNGPDPAANLVVEAANNRGTWDAVEGVTFTPKSRAIAEYIVSIPVDNASSYKFRICTRGRTVISEEVVAERFTPEYEAACVDAFATTAYFTVKEKNKGTNMAQYATVLVSENGGAFQKAATATEGEYLVATGLKDNTAYAAKVTLTGNEADAQDAGSFTTEAATQLPNHTLDAAEWTRVDGKTEYWWINYLGNKDNTPWATMNELTTSTGGSGTNMFNHTGTSYNAYSGTQPATVDGRECAYIATVGWGKNDANGSHKTKNLTAGELYLGHYDSGNKSAVYDGWAYASRPASVSFYYKYKPYNSADWGVAEISLVAADGSAIKTVSMNLTATNAFTQATLAFDRTISGTKPAKIHAKFISCGNSDCLSPGKSNNSDPGFGNTDNGRFTGSELWIDDITLNY